MGGKGIMRRCALALGSTLALGAVEARAQQTDALVTLTYAEQGWSAADRETFYTTSQGSHLIPYAWFKALKRTDVDELFAADKFARYGFLAHDISPANPEGLPVGFVIDGPIASGELGLTCAACHTGQLEYTQGGVVHALRIDGAPAKTDAQQFLDRSSCRLARDAGRACPVRRVRQGGARPWLQRGEGGASQGRAWQMGRAIRRVHGHQPARGEPMGTWPTRRVRDDLQPHRRARSRNSRQLQGRRRAGPVSVSYGTPRGRTARNGTAACKTDSTSRRSDAIPARSLASSPISPLIACPADAACARDHRFQEQFRQFRRTADTRGKDRRAASPAMAARNFWT